MLYRAEFIQELDLFMWLCHDRLVSITAPRFLASLICLRFVCPTRRLLAMSAATFFSRGRRLGFCRIFCQMVLYHPKLEGHQVGLEHNSCTLLVVQLV